MCDNCPYFHKNSGGTIAEGEVTIEPWILEQLNSFAIENAPNAEFHNYHDADEIVVRLKNWRQQTRPSNVKLATKEDFVKYFGYWM